jgi:hypothetical protein
MTLTIPLLNNATSLDVTAQDITRTAVGALVFGKSTLSPLESARIVLNVSSTQNVAARRLSQVAFAVDVTVSAVSNSQVIQFKSVLEASVVSAVQSALTSAGIPVGDVSTQQVVIVPSPSLASGGQFASCETHYDCNGMFCSAKKECMDCRFCLVNPLARKCIRVSRQRTDKRQGPLQNHSIYYTARVLFLCSPCGTTPSMILWSTRLFLLDSLQNILVLLPCLKIHSHVGVVH